VHTGKEFGDWIGSFYGASLPLWVFLIHLKLVRNRPIDGDESPSVYLPGVTFAQVYSRRISTGWI